MPRPYPDSAKRENFRGGWDFQKAHHDDLGRDAAVGELGDEAASAAMAGCPIDPGSAVKLREQLAKRVG